MNTQQTKEQVCQIARRAFDVDLQHYSGYNLSAKTDDGQCVIMPSGIGFARCTPANLMVVELDRQSNQRRRKAKQEHAFHLAIYGQA